MSRPRTVPAWMIAIALLAITVLVTWPLGAQLTRSLPGDYGDPLFVSWVIAWVAGQVTQALTEPSVLRGFWDANIFFPEAQTLAYSEHFVAQTLFVLPVYWATGNLILSYNVSFISSFVLTGLGTFLLARAITGSLLAGWFAACVVAFNDYRLVYEIAHLQVLSIQWFPFALLALLRYFETDKRRYLAFAAASLVLLNLSSVYYMAYCAPFVVAFALFEMLRSGRWRQSRTWLELWATAAVVLVATLPFILPYMEVQQRLGIVRTPDEVTRFSATLDHYRAALPGLWPPLVFATIGLVGLTVKGIRGTTVGSAVLLVLAFWLSLGPTIQAGGQALDWPGLYRVLYEYVPGYHALRVPARFATLFYLFLALLASIGIRVIERRWPSVTRVAVLGALVMVLIRATPNMMPLNHALPSEGLASPPAYLTPTSTLPQIYRAVDSLGPGAVLAEFPFGDAWYDLRYMYFAGMHRRRLMNGYSGVFPPSYLARQRVLAQPTLDPERAAQALSGATHVIVHRNAWTDDMGGAIGAWLGSLGARIIAEADGAALYEMPVREELAKAKN